MHTSTTQNEGRIGPTEITTIEFYKLKMEMSTEAFRATRLLKICIKTSSRWCSHNEIKP